MSIKIIEYRSLASDLNVKNESDEEPGNQYAVTVCKGKMR